MSLDTIHLPDFLIADLYKNCLVEVEMAKESKADSAINNKLTKGQKQEKPPAIKYLGQNEKQVAVIVNNSKVDFVNDAEKLFLTSILKACGFNLSDIAVINLNNQIHTYQELKENLSSRYLLLFGVEPSSIKLPFTIPVFQVQQYDGCTIIVAPALNELNNATPDGKLLKTKLWLSLQRCFEIK